MIRVYLRCPLKRSVRDVASCEQERKKLGCDYLGCSAYRESAVKRFMELSKQNAQKRYEDEVRKQTIMFSVRNEDGVSEDLSTGT